MSEKGGKGKAGKGKGLKGKEAVKGGEGLEGTEYEAKASKGSGLSGKRAKKLAKQLAKNPEYKIFCSVCNAPFKTRDELLQHLPHGIGKKQVSRSAGEEEWSSGGWSAMMERTAGDGRSGGERRLPRVCRVLSMRGQRGEAELRRLCPKVLSHKASFFALLASSLLAGKRNKRALLHAPSPYSGEAICHRLASLLRLSAKAIAFNKFETSLAANLLELLILHSGGSPKLKSLVVKQTKK
nr:hypothetical protein Iba_chr03bCG2820 [Ipomoea batatas]